MVISPDGRYLFMAAFNNEGPGRISTFAIDRNGRPWPLATIDARGNGSAAAALAPDGRALYVANMISNDVSAFAVGAGGSLRWLQTVESGCGAFFPAPTPAGRLLVVANALSNDLSVFRVTARGTLRPIGDPVASGGNGPRGVVISPDGRHVYVAHYDGGTEPGSVAVFTLASNGRLAQLGEAVLTGGNGAEAMALNPSTRRLFVANFNSDGCGSLSPFAINRDGSVSLVSEPIPTGGRQPDFGGLVILSK
jgi:6-phosphogluconolactonase (cycloisomerase 2 family)